MIRPDAVPGVAFGTVLDGNPRNDDDVRTTISDSLEIPSGWAWVRQVHGTVIAAPRLPGIGQEADALVTADAGLPVAVSVADCLPVALVADGAVGMAHAGWRGAEAGVVPATIAALTERGHPPHTAVIGPGIGPCCFEVGDDVGNRFAAHRSTTSWGGDSVDLAAAIADSMTGLAVHFVGGCTHHDDRFHSFRRDGTNLRQFGVAWVTPD